MLNLAWSLGVSQIDGLPAALSVAKRPSHFLLRAQEKVTKEKGTPERALGGRPARQVREGWSGLFDSTSCAGEKAWASMPMPPDGALSAHPSPPPRGPGKAGAHPCATHRRTPVSLGARYLQSHAYSCWDFIPAYVAIHGDVRRWMHIQNSSLPRKPSDTGVCRWVAHGCAPAFPGPLGGGEGWADQPAGKPAWRPACFSSAHGWAVEKPRPPFTHLAGRTPAKRPLGGALLFGYFLLGTQEKVTRSPTATESAAGNVSTREMQHYGVDSRLHGNNGI